MSERFSLRSRVLALAVPIILTSAPLPLFAQITAIRETVMAVIGHSIFNRTCSTDVGKLAARFGGGGHRGAGSIPLDPASADLKVRTLIAELRATS